MQTALKKGDMMSKEGKLEEDRFWIIFNYILSELGDSVCRTWIELRVVQHLGWKMLKDPSVNFNYPSKIMTAFTSPSSVKEQHRLCRAKSNLIKRNVIFKGLKGDYYLNILGIVSVHKEIFRNYYDTAFFDSIYNKAYAIVIKQDISCNRGVKVNNYRKLIFDKILKEHRRHNADNN